MKKLIVNHIDKIFVTNDASTILSEINVHHPAANLLVMACQMQKADFGDHTNYVVTLAGEFLSQAAQLIRTGVHPSDIISGYELALKLSLEVLEKSIKIDVKDLSDENVIKILEGALASKIPQYYKHFAKIVLDGCSAITQTTDPSKSRFNEDSFRICKIMGADVQSSHVLKGFVLNRAPESQGKEIVKDAVVACFRCPFLLSSGETKGTVLVENAQQLLDFSKSEEVMAEKIVKSIVELGVNAMVVGGAISDLMLHYLNKYGIFVLKCPSKFELLRVCRLLNAKAIPSVRVPTKEELGYCDLVQVKEIGSTRITVFQKDQVNSNLVTIVLRGATRAILDDLGRALENAVSAWLQIISDGRYVSGGGATESYIVNEIEKYANTIKSMSQYGVHKFGQAFEVFGKILVENSGMKSNKILPELLKNNTKGPDCQVEVFNGKLSEIGSIKTFDSYAAKLNAILLASKAALTVLRVDQIIMAKPAGGPKPKSNSGWDNQD